MPFPFVLGFATAILLVCAPGRGEAQANPAQPFVDFALVSPCAQTESTFEDLSQISESEILTYMWDLGDGSPSLTGKRVRHRYAQSGTYSVTLSLRLRNEELLQHRKSVVIFPLPSSPAPYAINICYGQEATLKVGLPHFAGEGFYWYDAPTDEDWFHRGTQLRLPAVTESITYYVESRTESGCASERVPLTATVLPIPDVEIIASPAEPRLPVAEVVFAIPTAKPIQGWQWDFGDGETSTLPSPVHEYHAPGQFMVSVRITDDNVCQHEFRYPLTVAQESGFTVPGAFSPNGDLVNDFFEIQHYKIEEFRVDIINPKGQVVFVSHDPNFHWDGRDTEGNVLPEGEYAVVIQARDTEGKPLAQKQAVFLIR